MQDKVHIVIERINILISVDIDDVMKVVREYIDGCRIAKYVILVYTECFKLLNGLKIWVRRMKL